jgi:GcrA cell cycle regulator
MIETTWTMERIALLKDRICAGFSCGQIARELGVSRNAVIGKTNRLGLSKEAGLRKNALLKTVTQRMILRALWAKSQSALLGLSGESAKACSLFELQQWHCRWPVGDPSSEDFGFCGNIRIAGLPYCADHARIAYRRSARDAAAHEQHQFVAGVEEAT